MTRPLTACGAAALAFAAAIAGPAAQTPSTTDDALVKKARGIHERVIALDTHDDISPADFTPERNYTQDLGNQVNLPKMVAGGLDASFFIVYVGQGPLTPEGFDNAYKQAVAKFDAVHLLTEKIAPDKIELALTAADVRRISKAGKKVALIGVENGYPLGDASTAVKRVKEFYDRGARYLSLAHNGHSQLADSNNGEASGQWAHNGLSELGKQVVAELNRVGIMVDLSHPSKPANLQAIALSKAPVIASHSSARALCDHSRNMDDELLLALKKNGGVVQTVAFAAYVKTPPPADRGTAGGADQARRGIRPARGQPRTRRTRWRTRTWRGRPVRPAQPAPRRDRAAGAPAGCGAGSRPRTRRRARAATRRQARRGREAARRDRQAVPAAAARERQGLRRSHRLHRQEDRHRSRRHLVGLRRRRRHRRLERRERDVQRHARARAARLHRGADRQDLERQSAEGDGRGPAGCGEAAEVDLGDRGSGRGLRAQKIIIQTQSMLRI